MHSLVFFFQTIVFIACLSCGLRILPHRFASEKLAVDHWYWKSYIEAFREARRFPPELPQYQLDQHQWYPPLFPLLMTALPEAFFARYSFWISIVVDLLRLGLLMSVTALLSGMSTFAVMTAGLVYATAPILVSYNTQLNPRGFGALFLDAVVSILLWVLFLEGPLWAWIAILGLSGLILLVHKMSTQLFWFLCLAGAFALQDWRLAALVPASVGAALLFSHGFYWKVLLAHWDIVSFWHRNWRWLQAHLIKESPIYGVPGYETPTKFHRNGLEGVTQHLQYLFGFLPAGWILGGLLMTGLLNLEQTPVNSWVIWWGGATLLFALLTVFVPFLKCLGSGYYYLYNAAFPAALMAGVIGEGAGQSVVSWAGLTAVVGGNLVALFFYYRQLRKRTAGSETGFDKVIRYLSSMPKGLVMCLPLQWSEAVTYRTKYPVLWGAHGYGFANVEPIFPRLMLPIREIFKRYRVRYLIAQDTYLTDTFVEEIPYESEVRCGEFRVFVARYDARRTDS